MVVDTEKIEAIIRECAEPTPKEFSLILKNADSLNLNAGGISLEECAKLLSIKDPRLLKTLCAHAGKIKEKIFGRRIVLFAPLYLSNHCANSCLYCGFRRPNKTLPRYALSEGEIIKEALTLEKIGFKRIILVIGQDRRFGLDYLLNAVLTIYKKTGIRIIHVNAPPMEAEEFKELKKSGVGVYQSFQETYHRDTYKLMHPGGEKSDYASRITVMDRAIKAGIQDVGIGSLLGLYDSTFDVISTISHSKHLYSLYGTHAHTISVPRIRPALGAAMPRHNCHGVSDQEFRKIVAVYRLALPTVGIVVSTRESARVRNCLTSAGASQMSACSKTGPGGYADPKKTLEQFSTSDRRTLLEVMEGIIEKGGLPSLCATCYRTGRVGKNFTEIARRGGMEKFCQANAILTLKEYLLENPLNGKTGVFNQAIETALGEIKEGGVKKEVKEKINALEKGKRDLFL